MRAFARSALLAAMVAVGFSQGAAAWVGPGQEATPSAMEEAGFTLASARNCQDYPRHRRRPRAACATQPRLRYNYYYPGYYWDGNVYQGWQYPYYGYPNCGYPFERGCGW
ncbi:hypothetical protein [Methylocystis heyeri]|uniref:Sulfur globule protein n=1 Tax=Methylocystis heyeri TaxID=391905 RepID=A0A6B8KFJ6_9HYPH|nr:hypothetical protein [Methylocystis heyeri]QGM45308.1 hypothetical protein H2LOC_006140 [Methylocystis heyeri]